MKKSRGLGKMQNGHRKIPKGRPLAEASKWPVQKKRQHNDWPDILYCCRQAKAPTLEHERSGSNILLSFYDAMCFVVFSFYDDRRGGGEGAFLGVLSLDVLNHLDWLA